MADLKTLRESVRKRRDAYAKAADAYYQALQWLTLAQQGQAQRPGAPPTPDELRKKYSEREDALFNLQAALNLLAQTDTPQNLILQVPADLPFLLLPVRVEARYITFRHVARHLKPGDWVDVSNVPGGEQYRRIGFENDEEGNATYQVYALHLGTNPPFANQVRSQLLQPAGKQYIQRHPDREELCIRIYPDEIFTEAHERNLTPGEWEAGKAFWEKICAKSESEETTWLNFSAAIAPARAAWIVRATRPKNYPNGGALPAKPQFPPDPPLKDGAYTLPPTAQLLPDRFVVRLYKGSQFKEFTGKPIPEPLRLGLDPTDTPPDTPDPGKKGMFISESGRLNAPEYLRWIHDLETAESNGLAVRVDLKQHPEFSTGVDKIFVLGVKLSADEQEGARLLNAHFENCLYKEEGMAILPQGTPTNNFDEQKSGFNRREAASLAYFHSDWLPASKQPFGLETDEMRLCRLLGLRPEFRLPGGQTTDVEEALRMNGLLWHGTWGYYLLQFFTPALSEAKRELLRRFFSSYVSGRGGLPVLRINNQPYGIVPTTAFSFWSYTGNGAEERFLNSLWTDFLSKLNQQWTAFSAKINAAANSDTAGQRFDASFLEMLGISASAAQFRTQWLAGDGLKKILSSLLAKTDEDLARIQKAENDYNTAETKFITADKELKAAEGELAFAKKMFQTAVGPMKAGYKKLMDDAQKKINALKPTLPGLKARRDNLKLERDKLIPNKASVQQSRNQLFTALGSAFPADTLKPLLEQAGIKSAWFDAITSIHASSQQDMPIFPIDGLPLSEERKLSQMRGKAWNYLDWLLQAKLLDVWNYDQRAVPAGADPNAGAGDSSLFGLLTRQALLRVLLETTLKLGDTNPGLWLLQAKDFDLEQLQQPVIKIDPNALSPTNRLHQQYKPIIDAYKTYFTAPFELKTNRRDYLSGLDTRNLNEWLTNAGNNPVLQPLQEVKTALELFNQTPTARLERLFGEHLDLCSHRLDAWMLGLVHQRLEKQRKAKPEGIYLGAFGYLLGLKPNQERSVVVVETPPIYMPATKENFDKAAIPVVHTVAAKQWGVEIDKNSERAFFYLGENPNPRLRLNVPFGRVECEPDTVNANSDGYLHLPSLAHATAAAILRAGYLGHRADTETEALSLQLNAPRVRQALQLLEGIQQGISLGEALGFYFERQLHENLLDRYRLDLRLAFPLPRTEEPGGKTSLFTALDGLALVKAYLAKPTTWLDNVKTKNAQGQPVAIPVADKLLLSGLAKAIEANYLDATGDLLLAESVYQTARGNTDRAAAALRALNTGGQAPAPDLVRTQQKGFGLTHRVGVVFKTAAAADKGNVWTTKASPRVALAPALNRWLARQLPPPDKMAVAVTMPDGKKEKIKISELGLEPLDLLYACPAAFRQGAQSVLTLCVRLKARKKPKFKDNEPDKPFLVDFADRGGFDETETSLFELGALLANLRGIVANSRPLLPADFRQPAGSDKNALLTATVEAALGAYKPAGGKAAETAQNLRGGAGNLRAALAAGKTELEIRNTGSALFEPLFQAGLYGMEEAAIDHTFVITSESALLLAEQAEKVAEALEDRIQQLIPMLANLPPAGPLRFQKLREAADALFGRNTPVFPDLKLADAGKVKLAYEGRNLLQNTGPDDLDNWLREAALVRQPLRAFRQLTLLRELFDGTADGALAPTVLQFPFRPGQPQPWIGGPLPEPVLEALRPEERPDFSLVLELPAEFKPDAPFAGMLIDEWPEFIPSPSTDTGVAFQYDQPNTEPPQVILLATTPQEGGNWQWEYLMSAVMDALDLSKKRLVTPTLIRQDQTFGRVMERVMPAIAIPFLPGNNNVPSTELLGPHATKG